MKNKSDISPGMYEVTDSFNVWTCSKEGVDEFDLPGTAMISDVIVIVSGVTDNFGYRMCLLNGVTYDVLTEFLRLRTRKIK